MFNVRFKRTYLKKKIKICNWCNIEVFSAVCILMSALFLLNVF